MALRTLGFSLWGGVGRCVLEECGAFNDGAFLFCVFKVYGRGVWQKHDGNEAHSNSHFLGALPSCPFPAPLWLHVVSAARPASILRPSSATHSTGGGQEPPPKGNRVRGAWGSGCRLHICFWLYFIAVGVGPCAARSRRRAVCGPRSAESQGWAAGGTQLPPGGPVAARAGASRV